MDDVFDVPTVLDGRTWQGDRRQLLAAGGLALTGALPMILNANQVEGQPAITAALSDKLRAIQFWSALSRMEFSSQLVASYVAAGDKPDGNTKALSDLGNYYQTAWRTAQTHVDWAKGIIAKHDAEISTFALWAISRYPLTSDEKATLKAKTDAAGGAGKLALTKVNALEDVGISSSAAIRDQQDRTGVPLDEDPKRRSSIACSVIGGQLFAAALSGQWELLTTFLVKLQLSGCL